MQNYEFLERLQADRFFADYLIANGWQIPLAQLDQWNPILQEHETITFSRPDGKGFCHLLFWVSSYRRGTSFTLTYKGQEISQVSVAP